MAYTVKKLAAISGVSVRTLHFYDEIGLLEPAYVGGNGYRYYEEEQLLTLQQILFFRELGFPLDEIRKIVGSSDFDKIDTLRSHRRSLESSIKRTRRLIETIDRTIAKLKGEGTMKDTEMFQGFDSAKQKEYERELIARFGEDAKRNIEESRKRVKGWKKEDWERSGAEFNRIVSDLLAQMQAGASPSHPEVQRLVGSHYEWLCQFWTPNRESYTGHGKMLAEHPDWRKFYDPYHPQLADFFAEAIEVYARNVLS